MGKLFSAALEREPSARGSYLAEATPSEPEVREEVERLLRADESAGSFLGSPLVLAAETATPEGWGGTERALPTVETLPPGTRVGPYRLVSLIGVGGMGEVYLAEDARLGRRVAVKFVLGATAGDRQAIDRFRREARAASALDHPGICVVHDVGELEGRPYLVMELLDGQSLKQRLAAGPLPSRDVLRLGIEIAEALEASHAKGILHRDIKPANLFLTRAGRAKVLDFGLAKLRAESRGSAVPRAARPGTESPWILSSGSGERPATLSRPPPEPLDDSAPRAAATPQDTTLSAFLGTEAGAQLGTIYYMSPEQIAGGTLDARTDVYSLGAVLYEMATGRRAFAAASRGELVSTILTAVPPPCSTLVPKVPRAVDRIIAKALAKDRERRHPSAGALALELASALRSLETPRLSRRALLVSSGAVVVAAGAAYFVRDVARLWAPPPRRVRVAVLPFEDLLGDAEAALFVDGFHDDLISVLGRLYPGSLAVIARTSAGRYRGTGRSIADIAEELDLDYVVEGSVRRQGDHVRVAARLIDTQDQAQVWSEIFDREVRRLPALQGELAQAVARGIEAELRPSLEVQKALARPINPAAYEAYLRGEYAAAISIDPGFASAYSGLAEFYFFEGFFGGLPPGEAFAQVQLMAGKAIELDPTLAAAYGWRALGRAHGDWAWREAEADFRRAIELQPSNTKARHLFAHFLLAVNRGAESAAECDRALEHDPFSAGLMACLGWHHVWAGSFEEALTAAGRSLEMEPDNGFAKLIWGWACEQLGRFDEAIAVLRETWQGAMPQASLAHALARAGQPEEAREILGRLLAEREIKYVPAYDIAVIHEGLGATAAALEWLDLAFAERSALLMHVAWDPRFRPLREEPRFRALVRDMGLPEREDATAPRQA